MKEVICKVCNRVTYYDQSNIQISSDGGLYVVCDHCMNEIKVK